MTNISFVEDDYVRDQFESNTRWVVELDNGLKVYQDDDRPNVYPCSAWSRLQKYCYDNDVYIKKMYLQFRSHIEHCADNKDGYFFCKMIRGGMFSNKNYYYYLMGFEENDIIQIRKWLVPELTVQEDLTKEINGKTKKCLISKNIHRLAEGSVQTHNT